MNTTQSRAFVRNKERRLQWREDHPVEVGIFECIDGRVHFPAIINGLPLGIVQSWENPGGKFDLVKWPRFQNSVLKLWSCAKKNKRELLWIVISHCSRSNPHLGCKGHDFDTKRAQDSSYALKRQFDHFFGSDADAHTIHVTIETDEDALILHGDDGERCLDLATIENVSRNDIRRELWKLYPLMSHATMEYLVSLCEGNSAHIAAVRRAHRPPEEIEHREWVLVVGQADWLPHKVALIVGPFDPQFCRWVKLGGKILAGNVRRKDFDRDRGIVLLASAQYNPDPGSVEKRFAEAKAQELAVRATIAIQSAVPELSKWIQHLTVTIDMSTRKFDILDGN